MGTDKAMLEVGGITLLERTASLLREAGAHPIVVVGGVDRRIGWTHVPDEHPGEGPLGGILSALAAVAPDHQGVPDAAPVAATAVVVVACDLPGLTAQLLRTLVEGLGDHDVAMAWTGRPEPLCAAWSTRCAPALRAAFAAGERSPAAAVRGFDVVHVTVDAALLANVNTPSDLAAFGKAGN